MTPAQVRLPGGQSYRLVASSGTVYEVDVPAGHSALFDMAPARGDFMITIDPPLPPGTTVPVKARKDFSPTPIRCEIWRARDVRPPEQLQHGPQRIGKGGKPRRW